MTRGSVGLLLLVACPPVTAADPAPAYRAGVAKVDITPDHPVRLNGFGFRRTESDGVNQHIHARVLAIDTGDGKPAVLMAVDVLGIPTNLYDALVGRLAPAGVTPERLAVTATHTHTGPMLSGANPTIFGTPIPPDHLANINLYTPKFLDKLEAAALAALKDLKPAKLSWGVGTVKFAQNRRKREVAPVDHDLPALFVRDPNGKARAVYVGYACHAVTLSHNKIGGDWPGYAAAAIEDTLPDSVALVAIGCGADQNPNSGVTGDKVDVAAAQGREVAAEVKRLGEQFLAPVTGPLTAKVQTLDLPLAELPTRAEWEEKAKRMDAVGHHARVTLAKLDRGETLPTSVRYPVQTWAFGDSLAMAHLPGEVVVDYAVRLEKELDGRRLWVTAYANNAPCYIPSERVLKEGGYEGGGAMIYYDLPAAFRPGLEEKIVGAVKGQLSERFAATFDPSKTGGSLPMSPQQSRAAIRVGPGLRVDLVVAEPLVADPVAIAFGPDGKLWVAEMADYPSGTAGKFEPGGRVVFATDADADGRLDASSVFLDGLPFPTGVLPWRKGVLICAAPDILYAEDTNADGTADVVKKLYSGFGTENYQARVNSLQYGLDGWVYGSCGLFGGNIVCHAAGKTVPLGDRDFRIKPDTGELEPATGRTQQGRVRDDHGNWFGCDNSNLIHHHPLDDQYLRRNPHVAVPGASVNVAAGSSRLYPLKTDAQRFELSGAPGTVTAACGLGLYRDNLLGPEFAGNSFTCEPVNLIVHRRQLKPTGSTFTGTRPADEQGREFLASADNWFRPVHATTGPDGGLWVADMCRFLIEHPRWIPPADLATIDPRAGAGLGRVFRVAPDGKPLRPWPRLDRLDTAGLVAALDSTNGWQRDTATMMLAWRNDPAAREPLERLLRESRSPLARLHAVCTLDTLGQLRRDVATAALADADPGVRRHAVRLAKPEQAMKLAGDPDPFVRLQVAYALGAWADPRAGAALAALALRDGDPHLTAAVVSSLNAENLPAFADAVMTRGGQDPTNHPSVPGLIATAAGLGDGAALAKLLEAVTRLRAKQYQVGQIRAVVAALDALARRGTGWGKLPAGVRAAVAPVVAFARDAAERGEASEGLVVAALPLLGRDPVTRGDDVRRLAGLLAMSRPAAVQSAAVAALGRLADPATPDLLVGAWPEATPRLREQIVAALFGRPAWQPRLLAAVERGRIPAGQLDAPYRHRLLTHDDAATRARAEKLFAGAANADRAKVVSDYEAALATKGDREKGRAVFAKSCAACHALDGVGTAVGPDLAALANKTPRYLLGEILDPSRNLDTRYAEYQATLTDGRVVIGVLAAESATGVTLRGQQGKAETILRTDLERLRGSGKSLMPDGLEKDIPPAAMADLIAFLTSADPPPKPLPGNTPAEVAAVDGTLTLPAAEALVHGDQITFEPEFRNIGYWHGANDFVAWRVRLDAPAVSDVYLDYACDPTSAGNVLLLEGADPTLRHTVAGTGAWSSYKLVKVGTVKQPAGPGRLTVRPEVAPRGALLDLRTVYLVPVGTKPDAPAAKADPALPKDPPAAAKFILDESQPKDRREAAVKASAPQAAEVLRGMTRDLPENDPKEEYRRIPWVWRVAIAAGRKNDTEVIRAILDLTLPTPEGRLRDWQAVVLGGGVVNGISLEGGWPARRLAEFARRDATHAGGLRRAVRDSLAMADDPKVPTGTRYDALRILPLGEWDVARPALTKYLAKTAHPELQMGAVSGLSDVERPEVAGLLVKALPDLTEANRKLAVAGLLRTPERATALLGGLEAGTVKPAWVSEDHRAGLLKHRDEAVRTRAAKVLGK